MPDLGLSNAVILGLLGERLRESENGEALTRGWRVGLLNSLEELFHHFERSRQIGAGLRGACALAVSGGEGSFLVVPFVAHRWKGLRHGRGLRG